MFLSGTLSIDPSQLTLIRKARPQQLFKRLVYLLSAGLVSDEQEHETFTAISILQQLNLCLNDLGITNIIRLAKDDYDIYYDKAGLSDDIQAAMNAFMEEFGQAGATLFETLLMVLEHHTDAMAYLIEIRVNRTHDVGDYPIQVTVNGVPRAFAADETGAQGIHDKFEAEMGTQAEYDRFVLATKSSFGAFLTQLESALMEQIKLDHVVRDSQPIMIRPMRRYRHAEELELNARAGRPFFHGYFGWERASFYAFHWAAYVHEKKYHVSDFILVDETDATLMSVGPIGFAAGNSNALSIQGPFEPPTDGDIALPPDRAAQLAQNKKAQDSLGEETRSWFDFDDEWIGSSEVPENQNEEGDSAVDPHFPK